MKYLKKAHMICLGAKELETIWKKDMMSRLMTEVSGVVGTLKFPRDKDKIEKIAQKVVDKSLREKENSEIFISLNSCLNFYGLNTLICFPLKDSINLKKDQVDSLENLIDITKENSLTDFAYMSDDGFRQFQLKQYKGELTTEKLFDFIKEKTLHYGSNSLNDINLIFALQGPGTGMARIDFNKLHKKISSLDLHFDGQILTMYNEEDKFNVINEVYPKITTCRKKMNTNLYTI